jgi:hypothetical protein
MERPKFIVETPEKTTAITADYLHPTNEGDLELRNTSEGSRGNVLVAIFARGHWNYVAREDVVVDLPGTAPS